MDLLEREPVLAALGTALGEVAGGHGRVVLISGEAGIGKTRLVAELIATLDPALPVLAGQGSQEFVGAGVPLSCVVAILVK